jgi:NAD(P)-dependent dehydrogenase (short-subunit alcohol dehydrogenase family)
MKREIIDLFDLTGKVAIVTGGNQGIGFAIARGLAAAGAHVVIANRRASEGEKAAQRLRDEGLQATAIPTDVARVSSIRKLATRVLEEHPAIDVLVNNAGVIVRKPAEDFTEEEWDHILEINLKGLFFCCQVVGREMIRRRKGKIINISSNVSEVAMEGRSVYAVSKAGVSHLTRALALEWAPYNVLVNAIGPGPTITDLNRNYFQEHPQDLEARIRSIPLARMGDPKDYVGAAVFLASEASNFITGQTLLVDGGSTIW